MAEKGAPMTEEDKVYYGFVGMTQEEIEDYYKDKYPGDDDAPHPGVFKD